MIVDGKLSREDLARAKKEEAWLRRVLKEQGASVAQTMLLSVDGSDKTVFIRKEGAK